MASNGNLSIPIVDLSPFTSGEAGGDLESRKRAAAADLAEKLQVNGSVGIIGHGVPVVLLQEAFRMVKTLFNLPYEDKMKAPHPDGTVPHRGYSGLGREQGAAKTALETDDEIEKDAYTSASDYKESYEIGSEENRIQYNIWLPEDVFPGFRHFTIELFWTLNKTTNAILDALIMSLNLSEQEANSVRALHTGHDNQLRLLHYPSISGEMLAKEKDIGRLGAHTDWSTFTLLFQDTHGGLEFHDRQTDEFAPATPKEGVVYMNIGDMFQRISNGFYPSARHRVVISGKAKGEATPARYSIPYFLVPQPDGVIEPQPSLVVAHGKQVYKPVTFNSYSEEMFRATQVRE
ncbi:putative leucoanthocyanidin dioxygenase [Talaromyces proteolyticus]|uniref:Leucoanthocyanidin dioxygenase n=1 Tax=Talaromyces proteolyticus TaxID=1131652 RepID=A0AAD4Q3A2_9EURO|nr:putative leucoanthocyanidin dioxygenase [Talaromyces proteolyticus]KAH8701528.1 putative leucoanthocyanidin dioxygenase [Talaromyces proteolyticus]